MKKRAALALAALLAAGSLFGCNDASSEIITYTQPSTENPVNDYTFISDKSSIFVYRDGSVVSQDVESFTADYYDVNELASEYVDPAVAEYNKAAGGARVSVEKLTAEDQKASLRLKFTSGEDFVSFNRQINHYYANWQTFHVCPLAKVSAEGYAIPATFKDVNGADVAASSIDMTKEGFFICIVDMGGGYPNGFSGEFKFQGDVAYVSNGVGAPSGNSVTLADAAGAQYIIFK